jgi:hypothetical protein
MFILGSIVLGLGLLTWLAGEVRLLAIAYGSKMISSFFPSRLARRRRANLEGKKEVGCGGRLPGAAASRLRSDASARPVGLAPG